MVYLDRDLREVVWVAQSCCDVQTKVLTVLNHSLPQSDVLESEGESHSAKGPLTYLYSRLFEGLFEQQWLQERVQLLPHILQQNRSPKLNAVLQSPCIVGV